MKTSTQLPPASQAKPAGINLPLILVRSTLPAALNNIATCAGSPAGNRIGVRLLAEAIRSNLNLPETSVMPCGELRAGFVWVECGPLPPAHAIAEILALLQGVGLADYFSILLLDQREKFFRPYHQGEYAGEYEPLTQEQVALEAAAFRSEAAARTFAFQQIMGDTEPKKP